VTRFSYRNLVSSYSKLTYIVDDVLLSIVVIRVRRVDGTYYIDLIILERCIVLVHVDYMICVVYSKSATKKASCKYNIQLSIHYANINPPILIESKRLHEAASCGAPSVHSSFKYNLSFAYLSRVSRYARTMVEETIAALGTPSPKAREITTPRVESRNFCARPAESPLSALGSPQQTLLGERSYFLVDYGRCRRFRAASSRTIRETFARC